MQTYLIINNFMEDKTLSEKESLALIARMIRNTQDKLEDNAGIPLLVWGYVTLATTMAVGLLTFFTGNNNYQLLWFLIPIMGLLLTRILNKQHPKGVRTFVDSVVGYVWLVIGVSCVVVSASAFFTHIPVLVIIMLMVGIGSAITGLVVKFSTLTVGGFISIVLAIVLLFVNQIILMDHQLLLSFALFALSFAFTCVIPGHVLRARAKKVNRKDFGSREVRYV